MVITLGVGFGGVFSSFLWVYGIRFGRLWVLGFGWVLFSWCLVVCVMVFGVFGPSTDLFSCGVADCWFALLAVNSVGCFYYFVILDMMLQLYECLDFG